MQAREAFPLAFLCVFLLRAFAFRGTNGSAFFFDIILVLVLATLFSGC